MYMKKEEKRKEGMMTFPYFLDKLVTYCWENLSLRDAHKQSIRPPL
jgi:hypothetical protein